MSESKPTTEVEPDTARDPVLDEEILEEWRWIMQERGQGRFDEWAGLHVAVVNRTVLGASLDPDLLRQYVAEKHSIDPRRIVTFFVEDGWGTQTSETWVLGQEGTGSDSDLPAAAEPFPKPDAVRMEVLEEWSWVIHERGQGLFDEYAGKHVAVVNRTVLGSSLDSRLLRQYVAEEHSIDPRRIVIFYVEGW
jgi:hypothetical protein